MKRVSMQEYLSSTSKSERDMEVTLDPDDYKLGATVEGYTQITIHAFKYDWYVLKSGSDIVWIMDSFGRPYRETIFRTPTTLKK